MKDWILTDDSSYQHVRELDAETFELIETHALSEIGYHEVLTDIVHLSDYDEAETASILAHYGYTSIAQVHHVYGEAAKQVIAECIFEQCASINIVPSISDVSWDEATRFIDKYIGKAQNCCGNMEG